MAILVAPFQSRPQESVPNPHHAYNKAHLDDPEGLAGVVLVQIVDISRQGDAEEVVLLPQAAQLLVQDTGAHGKCVDHRVHVDIPNLRGFISRGR